jgi:hypothetical protein
MTSPVLFDFVLDVNMAAKASSVTVVGKLFVREMGRYREKKSAAPISAGKPCQSHAFHTYKL